MTITANDLPAAILVEGGKLAEHELKRIHAFIKEVNDGNRDIVLVMETPAGVKITINPIGPSDPPEVISEDDLAKLIADTCNDSNALGCHLLARKLLETFSITKKS